MDVADWQPGDRLDRVGDAWPRILEPVELNEQTAPVLAGAASPTLTRYVDGKPAVSSSRALGLMRLPVNGRVEGRPERYLSVIMMVNETSPFAFSSQISSLLPRGVLEVLSDRHLDVRVEDGVMSTRHRVAVRANAEGWMSEALEVSDVPEVGEHAGVVLVGVGWDLPSEVTLRVIEDVTDYLDGFREQLLQD